MSQPLEVPPSQEKKDRKPSTNAGRDILCVSSATSRNRAVPTSHSERNELKNLYNHRPYPLRKPTRTLLGLGDLKRYFSWKLFIIYSTIWNFIEQHSKYMIYIYIRVWKRKYSISINMYLRVYIRILYFVHYSKKSKKVTPCCEFKSRHQLQFPQTAHEDSVPASDGPLAIHARSILRMMISSLLTSDEESVSEWSVSVSVGVSSNLCRYVGFIFVAFCFGVLFSQKFPFSLMKALWFFLFRRRSGLNTIVQPHISPVLTSKMLHSHARPAIQVRS